MEDPDKNKALLSITRSGYNHQTYDRHRSRWVAVKVKTVHVPATIASVVQLVQAAANAPAIHASAAAVAMETSRSIEPDTSIREAGSGLI